MPRKLHRETGLSPRNSLYQLVLSLLLLSLSACSDTDDIHTLRFSVLPDQQRSVLQQRYEPLMAYLEEQTGYKCVLIYSRDYRDLLGKFMRNEIDIARFGGVTFTMAQSINQAEPLVMRDIDKNFRSYFLIHADNPAKTLAEFKGKRFAFGSRLSTSGHLMPRYFLSKENIVPEDFFSSVQYSGAHDRTAKWVSDGTIDIGAANAEVINKLLAQPKSKQPKIRILQQTPPYADYVWAARKEIPETTKQKVINAFLRLSNNTRQGKAILTSTGAKAYLPALRSDFTILQNTASQLGLLGTENTKKH